MPKFTSFDPAAPEPRPAIGWWDTDSFTFRPDLLPPEANRIAMTDAEWDSRGSQGWIVDGRVVNSVNTSVADQVAMLLSSLMRELAARQSQAVTVTLSVGPVTFGTTPADQQRYLAASNAMNTGAWPTTAILIAFDGTPVSVPLADAWAAIGKVQWYEGACLQHYSALHADVVAGRDPAITAGWPNPA